MENNKVELMAQLSELYARQRALDEESKAIDLKLENLKKQKKSYGRQLIKLKLQHGFFSVLYKIASVLDKIISPREG